MQSSAEKLVSEVLFSSSAVPNSNDKDFTAFAKSLSHGPLPTYACSEPPSSAICTQDEKLDDVRMSFPQHSATFDEEGSAVDVDSDDTRSDDDEEQKHCNSFSSYVFVVSLDVQTDGLEVTDDGSFVETDDADASTKNYFWTLLNDASESSSRRYVDMRRRLQRFAYNHKIRCARAFGRKTRFSPLSDVLVNAASVRFLRADVGDRPATNFLLQERDGPKSLCLVDYQFGAKQAKRRLFSIMTNEKELINAIFVLINFRFVMKMHLLQELPRFIEDNTIFGVAAKIQDDGDLYARFHAMYQDALLTVDRYAEKN